MKIERNFRKDRNMNNKTLVSLLPCYDSHKSFYGKAIIKQTVWNDNTIITLQSYDTDIMEFNQTKGTIKRGMDGLIHQEDTSIVLCST